MAEAEKNRAKSSRVLLAFTPAELDAINEWWHANRIASRSEAIRELIRRGMAAPDEKKP